MEIVLGRRIIRLSLGREAMLTLLICIVWASVLVGYSKGIINRLPVLGEHAELTQGAFFVIPLLLALPALVRKFCLADYLFYFVCAFYFLWCYVAYPENSVFLTEHVFLCLCCVFPYYFIGRLTDIDRFFDIFVMLSTVCILMDLFYFLVYAPAQKDMSEVAGEDNMFRAYQSLPHVAMLLWATLSKFRIWKAVMFFLGTMFLLSCGTRGPLVCLGFFGFVYFLFFLNFRGAIYVKAVLVTMVVLAVVFLREIAIFLAQTFLGLNLSTRIMEKIVFGGLGNDTYRGDLREILYAALDKGDHFFGLGLFGSGNFGINYPHFMPLDFFCTFGYYLGSVLMILLAVLIVAAYWRAKSRLSRVFIVFLCSMSIVKLMFSATFVNEPFFFMLIGFCATQLLMSAKESSNGVEKTDEMEFAGLQYQPDADMIVQDNPDKG